MRSVRRVLASVLVALLLLTGIPATAKTNSDNRPDYKIKILSGSTIHLVSKSSKLPISIRNDYDAEVRVYVHVAPSNLKVIIPAAIEVTVPALTTYVAQVPITALADGEVPLRAWLTTFSGIRMGKTVPLNLVVSAEVENSLILGFVLVVAGLGIAGLTRTLRKRKRAET